MKKVFSINYEKVFTKKYKSQWFLSFLLYTMNSNLIRFICVLHGLRGTEKLTLSIESCKIYIDIYDSM